MNINGTNYRQSQSISSRDHNLGSMKASQLLLLYQCSLCFSTLIEMDDLSSEFEKTFDNAFGNPHGILAKGLLDPGKFESIFNSLLYNLDEKVSFIFCFRIKLYICNP